MKELNQFLRGWQHYFKLGIKKGQMSDLDSWIRRRLRCYRLKQRKRTYSIAMWLKSLGVTEHNAWKLAASDKGWWKLSKTPQLNQALPNQRFKEMGLYSLLEGYKTLAV
nr:group II intron maturase-specific domain-containing protein [Parashewanella curva]